MMVPSLARAEWEHIHRVLADGALRDTLVAGPYPGAFLMIQALGAKSTSAPSVNSTVRRGRTISW